MVKKETLKVVMRTKRVGEALPCIENCDCMTAEEGVGWMINSLDAKIDAVREELTARVDETNRRIEENTRELGELKS
ncbi:hypothetical protein [Archaeoglobus neptunius]|uniref:hypothetical protein n=1 Tax=Archaeoglobus neptunius TaxID=2798580 RepID=UPI0019297783|nr:hypothetical protein [Archaeoglobus neptunius]